MSATHTIKIISAWIAAHAGIHQSKTYLTSTTRWSERELTPSRLAWPMHPGITPTHTEQRLEAASLYNRFRPQACRALKYKRARPQVHINARGRKLRTPHINNPGRKLSGARTSALQAASLGGGGEGEEGSNPPVHREREGRGAIPTPYMHRIPTIS